ncbi:MAG: 16S rRNA (cytidine(1402)-2'-O)-methyltransferase [Chloroflexi bacterium]|nr:MAG: 16S rRNA (cytidine(1402)-2'-O)-methyltransferase [Chloroflexota bacterium]
MAAARHRGPRKRGGARERRPGLRQGLRPRDLPHPAAADSQLGNRAHPPRGDGPAIGKLYLIATPIGNLEDVSLRALRILQEAHMVACEDTRHTQLLLRKHNIRAKHLTSYTEFNHRRKSAELVGQMDRGWDVALVSDAGTPALSDPGEQLVVAAIAAGHEIVPVPGPAAAIAALVASGLPTREFTFVGFPEKKSGARRKQLARLLAEERTLVIYESPFRLGDLLADLAAVAPDARVAVAREMTKVHEEIVRGTASALAAHYASERPKGEITVVVAPANDAGGRVLGEREPGSQR